MVLGDLLRDSVRSMSILVLAADGTGSAEPIELGDVSPQRVGRVASPGGRRDRVPRPSRRVGDPAAALYAIAPGGGTVPDPRRNRSDRLSLDRGRSVWDPTISPDGRIGHLLDVGAERGRASVNGWGRVLDLDTGTERIADDVGRVGEPDHARTVAAVVGAGGRLAIRVRSTVSSTRPFDRPAASTRTGVHVAYLARRHPRSSAARDLGQRTGRLVRD